MGGKFIDDDSFDVVVVDRSKAAKSSRMTARASVQGGKDE